jgi:REP element-mobilizing transposase RayT
MSPPVDQLTPPADFIGFNDRGAFRNYERNLPHWRQPGATYFLTFRLNDSLPAGIIAEHQREQESWRERIAHERELLGGISQETAADYETFQIRACRKIEGFLDEGHGSCVLKDPVPRKIVCDALLHFHGDRGQVHGFAVMPNHVHIIVKPLGDHQPEALLHSWKRFTAREINQTLGKEGQLWQHDTWNRIIRHEDHWLRAMRYTLKNPQRARLLNGHSTVWWDANLVDSSRSIVREDSPDDPW